jgi:hypothetical protein
MADPPPAKTGERDWTVEVADRIESVVETVRDKTTVPLTKAARAIVFAVVAAILGLVAFFSVVLGTLRVLYVYLPIHPLSRRVWVADAIASAIFLGIGAFLWVMRQPRGSRGTG